ncbi:MAG: hypothetical protein A2846_02460 [Candidatus Doudnabacteria bacterium RIFCSPHIGHO2_01_FULL_49_9]|uniref:Uncharacterized protein n=1 Tax=Candidatus Doudnabacteria bacterium RIFCSPHIGHO2_01_FULL_49_9 TaxID=1817827 RepID=A0A1F5P2A3_9BACT|nr:MAG: hypothetical protein A2846_02460 [Candidatus Doudnabacteria bacterium RIFCSPHIGHO2_01_FULL_49_9]
MKSQTLADRHPAFGDPWLAIKLAFTTTTGKPVETITDQDDLPVDIPGFFARLSRYQRVLFVDIYTAKNLGDLARVLRLKRDYPHVEPVSGESEVGP